MKVIVKKDLKFPYTKDIKEGSILEVNDLGNDMYKTENGQLISKKDTNIVSWDISTLLNISRRFNDILNDINLTQDQKTIIITSLKSILKDELK